MLHTVNKFSSHPEGMLDRDQRTIFILNTKSIPFNCSTCYCDDCKIKYFDIRKKYLNSNVNCGYLHSNNFREKRVTRFFQSKFLLYFERFFCLLKFWFIDINRPLELWNIKINHLAGSRFYSLIESINRRKIPSRILEMQ